jgi:hypothetical protein
LNIAQGLDSGRSKSMAQRCPGFEWDPGRGGELENNMLSVLWVCNRGFHVVKYLRKVVIALLSLQGMVSGGQD